MCHGAAVAAFPAVTLGEPIAGAVASRAYGDPGAARTIAILPDIYGCNPFYQGLAAHFAARGARVYLVDPFDGLGELPEATREAAFARRHKVRDRAFVDAFEEWCSERAVTGVIGFCLGGLYVFELARRGLDLDLVGLYGFPQGLANPDPLPVPFDYLGDVTRRHVTLFGAEDQAVGEANIARLAQLATENPAIAVTVYPGVGHDFLPLLDSSDAAARASASDALTRCEAELLGAAA